MARMPPKSEWLKQYERERADAFKARSAQEGRDWGNKGDWAFNAERSVREALAASDSDVKRALRRDPGAVRSSLSPEGRAQNWTSPDWRVVLVGTESGIGDPYQYEHVHEAFDQAVAELNADPFYKGAFTWMWESINPAVHVFRMTPVELAHNPPRVYRAQKVVAKLQKETRPAFRQGSIVTDAKTLVEETLADYIGENATEVFLVIFVNIRNHVIGYVEYASGGVAGVEVNASGILRDALTSGAVSFITVHNHPSGDATPSTEDRALWRRLREAGELVGVPVLDNLVVGEGEFFSEMGNTVVHTTKQSRDRFIDEQKARRGGR